MLVSGNAGYHRRRTQRELILLGFLHCHAMIYGVNSDYWMTENQALYSKIGYVEYDRRVEKGYSRVTMRKRLA